MDSGGEGGGGGEWVDGEECDTCRLSFVAQKMLRDIFRDIVS